MAKTEAKEKHILRKLEELNLLDNFLFQETVSRKGDGEEFCRILLGTILDRPIRKVRVVPQKSMLGTDTDRHGIRMDAYIEEIPEEELREEMLRGADGKPPLADVQFIPDIYDIEPNRTCEKEILPKRMRYYHGLIDTKYLSAGETYDKLPNVVVITILPYDPFGLNRMVYTIQNQCVEEPDLPYDDGAKKIFLYTKGTADHPSQKLRDMLKYLENTTEDNVTNQDIEEIHRIVTRVRRDKEAGISYMKSWEIEEEFLKQGRAEGLEEGRAEGLEEGRAEGLEEGRREAKEQERLRAIEKLIQKGFDRKTILELEYSEAEYEEAEKALLCNNQ